MKMKASAITAAMLLALAAQAANAAEAVGYNVVTVPANSDALVSVPFNQKAEGSFTVSSVTAGGVTVAATLTENAFANSYYVRFTSGSGEGLWSTISANGTGGFELANTDVLSYISNGDTFRVYKHHTIGSLFPAGMYGISFTNGTSILVYENATAFQDKSASSVVSYQVIEPGVLEFWDGGNAENTVMEPDTLFVVRNSADHALTLVNNGYVPDYNVAYLLPAGVNQDMQLGSGFPVAMTLGNMGLGGENGRAVLVYDNELAGQDKSASSVVSYQVIEPGVLEFWDGGNAENTVIGSSAGYRVRLSSETGGKVTVSKPY